MKLHSPEFEKQLRRGVRQAVRSSPELRKEVRRTGRRKNYSLQFLMRPGLAALLAVAVWWISGHTKNPAAALAVISIWMFIWLCVRAKNLLFCLYAHPDLGALSFLPLHFDRVFRWQLQKVFRASLMSLVDLIVALGLFGWCHNFTLGQGVILCFIALLSWVSFLAMVLFCAARWPRLPYGFVPTAVVLLGWGCLITGKSIGRQVLEILNQRAAEISLLLPTGWSLSLGRLLMEPGPWLLLLLIPIAGVIGTMQNSLARLRQNYEFGETTFAEAPDLIPDAEDAAPLPGTASSQSPPHLGPTAIEEIILSRQFFAGPKWHAAGRLERGLWAWLNPREQALSEFVFPEGFVILAQWRKIFRNLFLVLAAAFTLGLASPGMRIWILGVGLFVTICQALRQILGNGKAFQLTPCSGVNIPIYAAYAIGFRELARLLFKSSFVQIPLFVPFIVICSTPIAHLSGLPVLAGILLGLKAAGLLLASRFVTVTLAFSHGTNDTTRFNFRSLALVTAMVGLSLSFLALGAAALFAPAGLIAWGCLALALLDAYALFRTYGWFYHANRFDLMKPIAP